MAAGATVGGGICFGCTSADDSEAMLVIVMMHSNVLVR